MLWNEAWINRGDESRWGKKDQIKAARIRRVFTIGERFWCCLNLKTGHKLFLIFLLFSAEMSKLESRVKLKCYRSITYFLSPSILFTLLYILGIIIDLGGQHFNLPCTKKKWPRYMSLYSGLSWYGYIAKCSDICYTKFTVHHLRPLHAGSRAWHRLHYP